MTQASSPRYLIVDRLEGDVALVEIDGVVKQLPAALLPAQTKEGAKLSLAVSADGALGRNGDALVLPDGSLFPLAPGFFPEGEGPRLALVAVAADLGEAEARLARLRARTPQGPGTFEL